MHNNLSKLVKAVCYRKVSAVGEFIIGIPLCMLLSLVIVTYIYNNLTSIMHGNLFKNLLHEWKL